MVIIIYNNIINIFQFFYNGYTAQPSFNCQAAIFYDDSIDIYDISYGFTAETSFNCRALIFYDDSVVIYDTFI